MKRTKVLIISFDFRRYSDVKPGGVEVLTTELARGLVKEGIEVVMMIPNACLKDSIEVEEGIKVYRFPSIKRPLRFSFFQVYNYKRLASTCLYERPDVTHIHTGGIFPPHFATSRVVASIHGSPLYTNIRLHLGMKEAFRERAVYFGGNILPKTLLLGKKLSIDRYVFVLHANLMEMLSSVKSDRAKEINEKSVVIYNGIDPDGLRKIAYWRDTQLTAKKGSEVNFVFMGRFALYKGVLQLIEAFKKVWEEERDARLDMFGQGPVFQNAVSLVDKLGLKEVVRLHGVVSRKRLLEEVSRSYAVVHPSLIEAGTMVVFEAYALGKPIVAHEAPWSRELVEDVDAGSTASVFNADEFANAMLTLLEDKNLYDRLSKNAENAVKGRFNIRTCVKEHIKLYTELIGK